MRESRRDGSRLLSGSRGETMKKPAAEQKEQDEGVQAIAIDLPVQAILCLKHLLRTGLYGRSIEEVAQRLIEERLRGMVEVKR